MSERQNNTHGVGSSTCEPTLSHRVLSFAIRLFRLALFSFYAVLFPFFGIGAITLLRCAETIRGFIFAVCALCLILLPLAVVLGRRWPTKRRRRFLPATVLVLGAISLYVTLLVMAPSGNVIEGSGLGSYWPNPPTYPKYSLFNLLPERDQVKLGTYLLGSTGLAMDSDQAERVRKIAMPLYRQMEEREEYSQLGSAMHYVWSDCLGGDSGSGHLYYYVPEHDVDDRLPLLLFLHGSGGNFRAYLYHWQKFSERFRCVVVCPSFGMGNWKKSGALETIQRARSYALEHFPVDEQRVYLIALSNGGLGASRAARANPDHYRGLAFISGVIEPTIITSSEFVDGWSNRPVLIIHGGLDRRIQRSLVDDANATMANSGVQVTYHVYPDEDHYLLFGSNDRVYQNITAWIRRVEKAQTRRIPSDPKTSP